MERTSIRIGRSRHRYQGRRYSLHAGKNRQAGRTCNEWGWLSQRARGRVFLFQPIAAIATTSPIGVAPREMYSASRPQSLSPLAERLETRGVFCWPERNRGEVNGYTVERPVSQPSPDKARWYRSTANWRQTWRRRSRSISSCAGRARAFCSKASKKPSRWGAILSWALTHAGRSSPEGRQVTVLDNGHSETRTLAGRPGPAARRGRRTGPLPARGLHWKA